MNEVVLAVLKVLTSMSTICVYLSPSVNMVRCHKNQSMGATQFIPFVCMFGNSHLWMLYGLFIDDLFPLAITTLIGQIMALVYIASFAWISKDCAYVARTCAIGAVPILSLTLYSVLAWQGVTHQSYHNTGLVLGYIGVATSLVFYGSPLIKIRTVLQTKSAACIPVHMCAMGAINNVLWVIYSIAASDVFIFIPNMGCFILASLQVALYFRFHPNKAAAASTAVNDLESSIAVCVVVTPKGYDEMKSPTYQALHSPVAEKRV